MNADSRVILISLFLSTRLFVEKHAQILSVQLDEFSLSEHTGVRALGLL